MPEYIASQEKITRPIWLAMYGPQVGVSIGEIMKTFHAYADGQALAEGEKETQSEAELNLWRNLYMSSHMNIKPSKGYVSNGSAEYIIGVDSKGRWAVALATNSNEFAAMQAWFITSFLEVTFPVYMKQNDYTVTTSVESLIINKYAFLLDEGASRAIRWFQGNVQQGLFDDADSQWDVQSADSMRFGEGKWRYDAEALVDAINDESKKSR
jgi:hypothetical protein